MGAELEKGRNLWGSNPKRAETSGNRITYEGSDSEMRIWSYC